jgi:7-cyano-7-deazaguanine synthase in queuosine biosynthesis
MANVVALSGGGLRAAVAAAPYAAEHVVLLLHFDYGQPSAEPERIALNALVHHFKLGRVVPIGFPYLSQLNQAARQIGRSGGPGRQGEHADRPTAQGEETPAAAGEDPGVRLGGLRGLLPVLLTAGIQAAARLGAEEVVTGLGDPEGDEPGGLPLGDGKPGAAAELQQACNWASEAAMSRRTPIRLKAPLIGQSLAEVIRLAQRYGIPAEKTWSCTTAGPRPCGECPGCKTRSQAFVAARRVDPLATMLMA